MFKTLKRALRAAVQDRSEHESGPVGNAPLDPFGATDASVERIAREFMFLRASVLVQGAGKLARHQDLVREHPEAFFEAGEAPPLVLFVSHRWRSPTEPDPDGAQAEALRILLRHVGRVGAAASLPPEARVGLVPSLRVHGVFQAAHLLGNQRPFGETEAGGRRHLDWDIDGPGAALEKIGVWFDYSCLPQGTGDVREPRSAAEQQVVTAALRRLHMLVAASTVLILRREDDDYAERVWCAAELSIGQPRWRHVVLRTDRLGSAVTDADLVGSETPEGQTFASSREQLLTLDDTWRTAEHGWGALRSLATAIFFGFPELEAERRVPMFVTAHAPNFFPGHMALLQGMIGRLQRLSELDRALDGGELVEDASALVGNSLEQAGLLCTDPSDRVYAGLLVLHARHLGAPEFAAFYGDCLRRVVDGRTTRLVHYREWRELLTMRCWWVFADEPETSERRRVPAWAQR